MDIFRWLLLSLLCLCLFGCSTTRTILAPVVDESITTTSHVKSTAQTQIQNGYYVVQRGDSLRKVAINNHINAKAIIDLNRLSPPYKLRIGQRLQLTTMNAAETRHPAPVVNNKPALPIINKPVAVINPQPSQLPASVKPVPVVTNAAIQWQWPAQGKILQGFSAQQGGTRGLNITNRYGTPIVAAAAGKIVYSGSGLASYGNLIIIKHNDSYLSAYAYNKRLLVKEGQQVKAGQEIAAMGRNAAGDVLLHFEIRRNGKPVNPLLYLKSR